MYITQTIMKFMLLDNVRAQGAATERYKEDIRHSSHYSDSYQHLDDLLDKTFVTDYFMDRSASTDDDHESSRHKNK